MRAMDKSESFQLDFQMDPPVAGFTSPSGFPPHRKAENRQREKPVQAAETRRGFILPQERKTYILHCST
jgi:hypothetical protein